MELARGLLVHRIFNYGLDDTRFRFGLLQLCWIFLGLDGSPPLIELRKSTTLPRISSLLKIRPAFHLLFSVLEPRLRTCPGHLTHATLVTKSNSWEQNLFSHMPENVTVYLGRDCILTQITSRGLNYIDWNFSVVDISQRRYWIMINAVTKADGSCIVSGGDLILHRLLEWGRRKEVQTDERW